MDGTQPRATLTDVDRAEIRSIVNEALAVHLRTFAVACVAPLCDAIAELQKSTGMLVDGQALIEKHLAGAFRDDDAEPWRESL